MAVHVDAQIAVIKAQEPLHVRFLIAMKRGVELTAELIGRITETIRSAFRTGQLQVAQDNTLLLTGKILDDLRRIDPEISYVHARVSSREVKDLYIVLNREALPRSSASA
jgi:hypothetical protein